MAMTATSAFGKTYTPVPPGTAPRQASVEVGIDRGDGRFVILVIDGRETYTTSRGARQLAAALVEFADKVET